MLFTYSVVEGGLCCVYLFGFAKLELNIDIIIGQPTRIGFISRLVNVWTGGHFINNSIKTTGHIFALRRVFTSFWNQHMPRLDTRK